jgi:tetratricopeptide (TPR) repeat protein
MIMLFVIFSLMMGISVSLAQAQSPQEILTQYISDLQKNPADYNLREKIIKQVQTMRPAPKTPEEVDELVGQAKYVFKHAKTQEDYLGAVDAYKKIVNITPWVGDYYYNLGVAQEQAGQPQDAINSFKLYLLASPGAKDAKEVRERIGGLKYAIERAAKGSSPDAIAEKKQKDYEEWLKKIDGARYKFYISTSRDTGYWIMDIHGNQVVKGLLMTWSKFSPEDVGIFQSADSTTLNGREFTIISNKFECAYQTKLIEKGRISDDGSSITTTLCNETRVYLRER